MTLISNLSGAFDVILGRERGLEKFDLSADGFWLSFVGLGMAGAVDAVSLIASYSLRKSDDAALAYSAVGFASVSLFVALLAYLASMVALYFLCRTQQIQQRFAITFVAHNWAAPLVSLAFLAPFLVLLGISDAAGPGQTPAIVSSLFVGLLVVLLLIGIRIIRISLKVSVLAAVLLFAGSAAVSWLLESWLMGLFGL